METISAGEGPHFIIQDVYFLSMTYHCWPHLLKMRHIHVRYCHGPSLKVADESAPAECSQRQKIEQEHAVLQELKNTNLCPDPSKTQRWHHQRNFCWDFFFYHQINLLVLWLIYLCYTLQKKYFRQPPVFRLRTVQTCSKQVWATAGNVDPCQHPKSTPGSHWRPSPAELNRWKTTEQEVQQVRPTKLLPMMKTEGYLE